MLTGEAMRGRAGYGAYEEGVLPVGFGIGVVVGERVRARQALGIVLRVDAPARRVKVEPEASAGLVRHQADTLREARLRPSVLSKGVLPCGKGVSAAREGSQWQLVAISGN